jgi:hypothetical protein
MNNKLLRITNLNGRHFNVRLLKAGDHYGLDDKLIHDKTDRPTVEFFDATYEGSVHGPLGQFTTGRYYVKTILNAEKGEGLNLLGYEPDWSIDGEAMDIVRAWLHNQTEGEI